MTRFPGLWLVVYMLASGSLSAHAATKKPAPAAAKKAAAPSTALHKVEVLRWSFDKWIPGMFCTKVDEPIDPHGWDDNFLCSTRDLGLRWSSLGPVHGMVCTQFEEDSDPDSWGDNYLCAPQDYGFKWSMKGTIKGMQCLQITEPYDPHTWKDNFLCWPPAGAGPLNAVVSPPQNATDVLNLIRAKHNYQTYLELGQGAREDNFDAIGAKIRSQVTHAGLQGGLRQAQREGIARLQNSDQLDRRSIRNGGPRLLRLPPPPQQQREAFAAMYPHSR